MARSRSRYGTYVQPVARPQFVSLASLLQALNIRPLPRPASILSQLEDRRYYHPLRTARPARGLSRLSSSLRLKPRPSTHRDVLRFAMPRSVAVCVRRKQRREVIHALNKRGAGARAQRRRNAQSDISCR